MYGLVTIGRLSADDAYLPSRYSVQHVLLNSSRTSLARYEYRQGFDGIAKVGE